MIYYEISFPLTLSFKYNFVTILFLMFISISISLKTSNILENKLLVLERSDCTIIVHNDLYYNESLKFKQNSAKISNKTNVLSRKNAN